MIWKNQIALRDKYIKVKKRKRTEVKQAKVYPLDIYDQILCI